MIKKRSSTWITIVMGSLVLHFMLWTTFRSRRRYSTLHAATNRFNTNSAVRQLPPGAAPAPLIVSEECRRNPDKAVDSKGNPCMDLVYYLRKQSFYRSTNPHIPYVYCAIPKNGCTYHLSLLARINGLDHYERGHIVHSPTNRETVSLHALDNHQIAHVLVNRSIPKYLVVRNPMYRTLSAYLDKVEPYLPEYMRTIAYFHRWIYDEFPADQPIDRTWEGVDPHWTPQMEYCGFRQRNIWRYFKFFRAEEPDEYVDFLYKLVPNRYLQGGWRRNKDISFRDHILGPRKRTGNTKHQFLTYFSKIEVFDHLAAKLVMDIDTLGYRKQVDELRAQVIDSLKSSRVYTTLPTDHASSNLKGVKVG